MSRHSDKQVDAQYQRSPLLTQIAEQITRLPRLARWAAVLAYSLAFALVITPVVDNFYVNNLFSMETRMLPALLSSGAGFVLFLIGWRLMIGYAGESPRPSAAAAVYFVAGLCFIVLVAALIFFGLFQVAQV